MGRIREFYSNEEEMKEMGDKEKKEGDVTVVVAKEDLNEVSNVESKPDSNESCSVEQKTAWAWERIVKTTMRSILLVLPYFLFSVWVKSDLLSDIFGTSSYILLTVPWKKWVLSPKRMLLCLHLSE